MKSYSNLQSKAANPLVHPMSKRNRNRNRMVRSSSLGNGAGARFFGSLPLIPPPTSSPSKKPLIMRVEPKPPPPPPPCRSILAIGSPIGTTEEKPSASDDEGLGAFLESCHACKKDISSKDDVFMCGYLRAFCSLDCRNNQIASEEKDGKPSPNQAQKIIENFLAKGLQARHGFNDTPAVRPAGA